MRSYFALPIGRTLVLTSVLLSGWVVCAAGHDGMRAPMTLPVFVLTWFVPPRAWLEQPVVLVIGFARVLTLIVIPLLAMRLFPEERQMRTMEMLLTSPVTEFAIVLGKWLAALSLYLILIGIPAAGMAIRGGTGWRALLVSYAGLALFNGALLSAGECVSALTRHQAAAAAACMFSCVVGFRYFRSGVLRPESGALFTAVALAGWYCSVRAIRALRNA